MKLTKKEKERRARVDAARLSDLSRCYESGVFMPSHADLREDDLVEDGVYDYDGSRRYRLKWRR